MIYSFKARDILASSSAFGSHTNSALDWDIVSACIHCNNAIVILTILFVIRVARFRYRYTGIWWYCICTPWDQSN